MRIILLTPARRFIANRFGLGFQIPLGLVLIGGPLLDAGHAVRLIDNDAYGWSHEKLIKEIQHFRADCVMLGHTGSTAAHDTCTDTARALRNALPDVRIVYGGVYPTYAANEILQRHPAIDVIVRGEGEQTVLDLVAAWENGDSLASVKGIAWRDSGDVRLNPMQHTITDLDRYRPGWELVDWPRYTIYGVGRSAGMQFSRGCTLSCTYCGQWMFWRKWRHRSAQNMVAELTTLARDYGVKYFWFADEFFGADQAAVRELLQAIAEADLDLSLNINMTAAGVVRDAELLPLYKAAGVEYVVMGVESLEDETLGTLTTKLRKMYELDADILNACYITPHSWTADGRQTKPEDIIQRDQSKWTYRNQIVATPKLSPGMLFAGVKLTEALFHLRPAGLARLFVGNDARVRKILRASFMAGVRVVAEVGEFLFRTRFVRVAKAQLSPTIEAPGDDVIPTNAPSAAQ